MRARPRTLRGRVSVLAMTVIAGWLVVLAVGFDLVLSVRLDQQVDDALRVRAQAASATIVTRIGPDGVARVVGVRESSTDGELDSSIWVYAGRYAIDHPRASAALQKKVDSLADSTKEYVDGGGYRFYVLPILAGGQHVGALVAAIDLDPYERTRDTIILGSIVVMLLVLAGAYPVLRYATGRALQPVNQMTQQAAEWSVNAPNERFGATQHYAELRSLAGTLDELLDRMAAVLRHERQLSAELSHELRTPLARVAAEVDLMLDRARPDQQAELLAIRENCSAMDRLMDTLLAAARSDLVRTVGRCELGPVLASFAAAPEQPRVRVAATNLAVGVEAEVVTRMLAPILENAHRFARHEISMAARRVEGGVEIVVANDGPIVPAELTERIFEPGYRSAAPSEHDGAGLGLALARRLARSADGELTVDEADGQTRFRLVLPGG